MSDAAAPVRVRAMHLAVRAGDRAICDDLDFEVRAGRVVHIEGASGRGKSTLLRAVLGLAAVHAGEVQRFDEHHHAALPSGDSDVSAWRGHHVGVVLQSDNLFADWTASDHLRWMGAPADAAALWLARMGLRAQRHARARTLSGGEQRRLAVARALCLPRALLVLDEPTEGLDAGNARRVWQAIGERVHAGAGVLVASHDAALPAMLPCAAISLSTHKPLKEPV